MINVINQQNDADDVFLKKVIKVFFWLSEETY